MTSLQNNNVTLRDITVADAHVLMEMNNDPETSKYVVGNPSTVTLEEQIEWIKRLENEVNTVRFMIETDSQAVGTVIVSKIDIFNKTGNLNIKLLKHCRGKGIGKKAINLTLEYCFNNLGLYCVTAHILYDNLASQGLFESIGFTKEGTLRSRVIKDGTRKSLLSYSMLKPDFISQ